MRVYALRTYDRPDLANHVIHFTGRYGPRQAVPEDIVAMAADERVGRILSDGRIRAFTTFGSAAPVVCLTESTKTAVTALIAQKRYEPCGIGFSKQLVFNQGGGPALYVRGDEWPLVENIPQPLRSRIVRFWPGAVGDRGETLSSHLSSESEWLHEREWRCPSDLVFSWSDVEFLIVPDVDWQARHVEVIRYMASPLGDLIAEDYGDAFEAIPVVVIDDAGNLVEDKSGVWR